MIAYIDFVEGLQKYFERCKTASTKRKLLLLIFASRTEHCRGYNVSEHASNQLPMFADSSDATVPYYTTVTSTCT